MDDSPRPAPGRYYIKTFGCQMNEYDSTRMGDVLEAIEGLQPTDDPAAADVLLVNTCSVREKAESKVFSLLGEWKQYKDSRPGLIIGVGGCVASQEGEQILKAAPQVDLVFGPQTVHRLPQMIAELRGKGRAVVDISFPEIEKFDHLPAPRAEGPTAFVSIMEGCSKYCSFCVVPYTRGDEISRPLESVIEEVVRLAEQGVREVTLLGQNVNAYQGEMSDGAIVDLATLLHHVAAIPGIERMRFTTSHPLEFSDSLIEAYASLPKLANHLHLPVQSGSDRVLAAMKRGYTALEFKSRIRKLREVRTNISVTSDFIVGFPGETDADFEATLALVAEIGFAAAYSFKYSPRPGTPAALIAAQVPESVQDARLQRLQALLREQQDAFNRALVGKTVPVMYAREGRYAGQLVGKTPWLQPVHANASSAAAGQVLHTRIAALAPNSLAGEICDATYASAERRSA
jgi:tRNA-2-methylthio-N6-dimethylallyladenosine synthase